MGATLRPGFDGAKTKICCRDNLSLSSNAFRSHEPAPARRTGSRSSTRASFTRAAELMHVSQPGAVAADQGARGGARRRADRAAAARHPAHRRRAGVPAGGACGRARRGAGRQRARAAPSRCIRRSSRSRRCARSRSACSRPRSCSLYDRHPGYRSGCTSSPTGSSSSRTCAAASADIAVGPRPLQTTGPVERLGWEEFVVVVGPRDPLARGDGAPGCRSRSSPTGAGSSIPRRTASPS